MFSLLSLVKSSVTKRVSECFKTLKLSANTSSVSCNFLGRGMEKHKCKLCARRFGSGRALGGHMRSHFTILPVPTTKTHLSQQLSETETSSTSSSELKMGKKERKKRKRSTIEFDQLEVGSVSEESSEEDHLAMCLMLLSRDKWVTTEQQQQQQEHPVGKSEIHECQVCNKVFKSGQALGGHKRSHLLLTSATSVHASSSSSVAVAADDVWLIDLNLPAPLEEAEDINQTQIPVFQSCVNFRRPI